MSTKIGRPSASFRAHPRSPGWFRASYPANIIRAKNNAAMSSLASDARRLILVFHLAAGPRFQTPQQGTNVALPHFKDHGLLMIVVIRIADGQEMLAFF